MQIDNEQFAQPQMCTVLYTLGSICVLLIMLYSTVHLCDIQNICTTSFELANNLSPSFKKVYQFNGITLYDIGNSVPKTVLEKLENIPMV